MFEPIAVDPSRFDDPIADQLEWTPVRSGGATFRTRGLVEVNADRLEFRATREAVRFFLVFLLSGVGVAIGVLASDLSLKDAILPILAGALFAIGGGWLLYSGTAPVVVDKQVGYFWKGRKGPHSVSYGPVLDRYVEIDEVHAIQLLSERCSGEQGEYLCHELNLVLGDGRRIHAVNHGDRGKLQEDAVTFAEFLNKPLWDGTVES